MASRPKDHGVKRAVRDAYGMGNVAEQIALVRQWVDRADRVVGLTGAGISTNSGIPDFRGPQGVWTRNPQAERQSNINYWMSDPDVRKARWSSMVEGRGRDRRAPQPNEGHHAFVTLAQRGKLHTLVTQNVDGLHIAAGLDPEKVVEVHGNTREVMCLSCDDRAPIEKALDRVRSGDADPACRSCGGILKTATISFGQSLRVEDLIRAEQAATECDLLLCVGSTLSVYPVAGMVPAAKQSGAAVVIVNAEPTAMDDLADAILTGDISEILPAIV